MPASDNDPTAPDSADAAPTSLAHSPIAHLIVDAAGSVAWANRAARDLLGADATERGAPLAERLGLDRALDGQDPRLATRVGRWLQFHGDLRDDGTTLLAVVDAQPQADWRERAERLDEHFEIARELGRLGTWHRNIRTGEGHWDRQVYRMWGLQPRLGAPDFARAVALIVPDDRNPLVAYFEASIQQAGTYQFRYRVRHPDGQLRRLHSQWVVQNGDDGRPERVTGLLMDDTEAWQQAQAHDERESELSLAEELTGLARWRHDLRTNQFQYNRQAYTVLDLPRDGGELTIDDVRGVIHPDDLERVIDSARHTLQTGEPTDFEARYRRPDGSWRSVLTRRALLRDAGGQPMAFMGVSMDLSATIAAKRQAQILAQRLELAASSAGVGYWSLEPGDERARWSDVMRELHGLAADAPIPSVRDWIETR